MSERQYSKVYHLLADEYPTVFDGPDLAAYVRLLVAANQAWPTAARWPGYATKTEVQRLATVGLVLLDGQRFRIKGLDKERTARSEAARHAARTRHADAARTADSNADGTADRTADRIAEVMPNRVEKNRVEQSSGADGIFDAYYQLTAKTPSSGATTWLNRLADEHDERPLLSALVEEHKADPDPSTLLGRVQTRLADQARRRTKAAEERRKRSAIDEQRDLEARLAAMTPEDRARADAMKAQIDSLVKGMPA